MAEDGFLLNSFCDKKDLFQLKKVLDPLLTTSQLPYVAKKMNSTKSQPRMRIDCRLTSKFDRSDNQQRAISETKLHETLINHYPNSKCNNQDYPIEEEYSQSTFPQII